MFQHRKYALSFCAAVALSLSLFACSESETGPPPPADVGETCGGAQEIQCVVPVFCQFPAGSCGQGSAQGTCTNRPQVCTLEFNPVCGCDGTTYSNACQADSAGVSVASAGEC